MDQESMIFDHFTKTCEHKLDFSPKSDCSPFIDDDLQDLFEDEIDLIKIGKDVFESVWGDNSELLNSLSDVEGLKDPSIATRLLHLACKLDSVDCARALIEGDTGISVHINDMDGYGRTALHRAAEMHSTKCVELLLRKNARTDLRTKDELALLPLEIALLSKRLQILWNQKKSIEDLIVDLSETDLIAVSLLGEKTREFMDVAYVSAMQGRVVALATLLAIDADKVKASMLIQNQGSSSKEESSIYECVIREIIALGQKDSRSSAETQIRSKGVNPYEKRKLLLYEMELLQLFGAVSRGGYASKQVKSPLISASQAGDDAVVKLLLKTKIDVNETDGDGNSALHLCLKGSSNSRDPSIVWLLLKKGAVVHLRNRLGLTPLHVAAANGNYQALEMLLLQDQECVNVPSETKETPLFFAVKNDFMDCAKLLLRCGANSQALNLRERPIDLAKSQDMRFMLSQTNFGFGNRVNLTHETPTFWVNNDESNVEIYEGFADMKEEGTSPARYGKNAKTEICRYYESPGGCVRGAKCFYAHGEEELRRPRLLLEPKQVYASLTPGRHAAKQSPRIPEELNRKIFVGGLPPSVTSDCLRNFFERLFGPVEDAVVIGSQAGQQIQSRGFGFISFKHEDSAAAAVHTHYVTILGKKVEIKSAVPKVVLLQEFTKLPHQQQKQDLLHPNDSGGVEDQKKQESTSWVEKLLSGPNEFQLTKPEKLDITSLPSWVSKFLRWLPGFLTEVSKRLKEGEWYPLSSLKGDFRATCGLELDHTSLGFLKLSDFMRSFPGLCRMKVVPVGRGAATHMVLLPLLPNNKSYSLQHHQQLPQISGSNNYSPPVQLQTSLVDEFRLLESLFSESCCFENVSTAQARMPPAQEDAPSVDPRFISFLQRDRSFLAPWFTPLGGAENSVGKESQRPPFSFFVHQWDYYWVDGRRLTPSAASHGAVGSYLLPTLQKLRESALPSQSASGNETKKPLVKWLNDSEELGLSVLLPPTQDTFF